MKKKNEKKKIVIDKKRFMYLMIQDVIHLSKKKILLQVIPIIMPSNFMFLHFEKSQKM